MELIDVVLRRSVLPSASPVTSRVGRRRRSARVACIGGGVHGGGPPQVLRGGPVEEGDGGGGEGPAQAPGYGAHRRGRGQGEGPLGSHRSAAAGAEPDVGRGHH